MKLFSLLLAAAVLLMSSPTFAGQYKSDPVYIDLINQVAMGNLYATRFSDNPDERIGCAVANGDERGLFGYCKAKFFDPDLAELVSADCFTYDTKMIESIASINTYSFVYFSWEQQVRKGFDDNVCTNVTVATRSTHIPAAMAEQEQVEGELLGKSTDEVDGGGGTRNMDSVCSNEFGDGAMMCTTQQVLESPRMKDLFILGWVRPIVIQTFYFGTTGDWNDWAQVEYSGEVRPRAGTYPNESFGWRVCFDNTPTADGTMITPVGKVQVYPCEDTLPVMCCR